VHLKNTKFNKEEYAIGALLHCEDEEGGYRDAKKIKI